MAYPCFKSDASKSILPREDSSAFDYSSYSFSQFYLSANSNKAIKPSSTLFSALNVQSNVNSFTKRNSLHEKRKNNGKAFSGKFSDPFVKNANESIRKCRCQSFDDSVSPSSSSLPPTSSEPFTSSLIPNPRSSSDSLSVTPESLWKDLKPLILYLPENLLNIVYNALQLSYDAHDGQKRKSGEPYIIHPVEVAKILGELEIDYETIVAGLLHDTVEDTNLVSFEMIEDMFGANVRKIVEGETKVSKLGKVKTKINESLKKDVKADDLRQMFLAMTEEVRIIIVKLADRLHNMRTLNHMPPHKQVFIANETLTVFAPLARLLGIYKIKSELEDLSFMYTSPTCYSSLKQHIEKLVEEQNEVVLHAKEILLQTLLKDKFLEITTLSNDVLIIQKEPYNLHKRIVETGCTMEEVRDVYQLRIILKLTEKALNGDICNSQQVCYHVLGLIHAMWPPLPGTVKDYIATPKPNGYQSLHTMVLPLGSSNIFPLEVQIRTEEMDKLAERGIAACYSGIISEEENELNVPFLPSPPPTSSSSLIPLSDVNLISSDSLPFSPFPSSTISNSSISLYSGSGNQKSTKCFSSERISRHISWLNSIKEWQKEFVGNMSSREFVDTITLDLLSGRIFVFTPKGEVKNLPKGATVVDYAYHIHTDLGNKMIGAKVNGNLVSPIHVLSNAEIVEILTYEGASTKKVIELHLQWLSHAKTRSARHKLIKFLKDNGALKSETEQEESEVKQNPSSSSSLTNPSSSFPTNSLNRNVSTAEQTFGTVDYLGEIRRTDERPLDYIQEVKPNGFSNGAIKISSFETDKEVKPFNDLVENGEPSSANGSLLSNPETESFMDRTNTNGVDYNVSKKENEKGANGSTNYVEDRYKKIDGNILQNEEVNERVQRNNLSASSSFSVFPVSSTAFDSSLSHSTSSSKPQILLENSVFKFLKWREEMIRVWHAFESEKEGVQWLSVYCRDRTGILSEVSGILTSLGFMILTHAGQTDRKIGVGIMLFEIKGDCVDLDLCSKLEQVEGVFGLAVGCSLDSNANSSNEE